MIELTMMNCDETDVGFRYTIFLKFGVSMSNFNAHLLF